jgi:hypothetical protein
MNAEQRRLEQMRLKQEPWRKWGPYLSERQWGTVREDYSADGNAWGYFTHEMARARAYRWGEDGLAGVSDEQQHLCWAVALWNGKDPLLKERLFGLTNSEGNHGEDVKEVYYYLDATPTHSYLKMLYKYPQREFPYQRLREESQQRSRGEPELELLDTGIFADQRYFDVFVEYAKIDPDDLLQQITVINRGPDPAPLHLLSQLWFRNTWSWQPNASRPRLELAGETVVVNLPGLGAHYAYADGQPRWLFCDNDTNVQLVYHQQPSAAGYWKDAFHEYVVRDNQSAVNPQHTGTKSAAYYQQTIPPGGQAIFRLRLSPQILDRPFATFDLALRQRRQEADEFYAGLQCDVTDEDVRRIHRQALAGMIWSKQHYGYHVDEWLHGDPAYPPPPEERRYGRNHEWKHLYNGDIISMPDKWEYPWYAAWDLAFHCLPLALVDAEFAKDQLRVLTRAWYMHPNGQLPAYEWNFSDVNPPVHAWATWRVFQIDRRQRGDAGDLAFLERVFHKLLLNFTWWVNRKDAQGRNIFQGGFLGLDNIGVFDRSQALPTGGFLNQADATSWMAMFCLNLLRISLELSLHNSAYEDIATKFFEHFLDIAAAMTNMADQGIGLWDEQDEFYYDVLNTDHTIIPLRLRSMVGLIPLFAVETLEPETIQRLPEFRQRLTWYLENRPERARLVSRWQDAGRGERRLLSLLRGHRMKALLKRMLDETEFLSPYGIRALSRIYKDRPYVFNCKNSSFTVQYQPAESDSGMFGGNSNWRGPIWMPVNFLIIESLQRFHHYYGDDFKVECPTGSGRYTTILGVSEELTRRLLRLFTRDAQGRRPVLGDNPLLQNDPQFRDYLLFHEYFDGDNGRGVGAAHQTGWTGLIAKLIQPRKGCR